MLRKHVDIAVVTLEAVLEANRAAPGSLVDEVHCFGASLRTEGRGKLATPLAGLVVVAVDLRVGERLGHRRVNVRTTSVDERERLGGVIARICVAR